MLLCMIKDRDVSSSNSQEEEVLRVLGIATKGNGQEMRAVGFWGKNRTGSFLGWVGTFEKNS